MATDSHPGGDPAGRVGDAGAGPFGISCSGGGIRSAAFNLGALQSLDEAGVLRSADYLSAVSGGSYIASAYAIASRHSDPDLLARQPAYARGSPEERWVRNHCSYLTNGFGDTMRVAAIAVVGLLANLVFFTTLLWTLARPLGWFYGWWQPGLRTPAGCDAGQSAAAAEQAGCYDVVSLTGIAGWAIAAGAIAAGALTLSLAVRMFQPGWPLRQTLRRVAATALGVAAVIALVAVALPELLAFTRDLLGGQPGAGPAATDASTASSGQTSAANLGLIATAGGAATIIALVVQIARPIGSAATAGAKAVAGATRWTQTLSRGLRRVANLVLGALIGPIVLAAVALLILNGGTRAAHPSRGELLVWAVMAVLTLVMLCFADVTSWSMHPLYKWRLSRTFAAVRVPGDDGDGPNGRATLLPYERPLTLSEFRPEEYPGGRPDRPAFPELLVCAAVNVSDEGTTPPGRSCLSFVFSPRHVGYPRRVVVTRRTTWWRRLLLPAQVELEAESYGPLSCDTATYEDQVGRRRRRDITLPAAMAMSGAAIAPSMGKMTKAPYRFLYALTNLRLGVWLPNPANMPIGPSPGDRSRLPANPRQVRLLFEVMGRHRVRSKFLYVTDGGHIENLGLLELLRRRCRTIVCLDAAGGSTTRFSTLGEAISLAASELNVTVDIDPSPMGEKVDGYNKVAHATGTIHYPDGTTGTLVYGKSLVTPTAPWDVRAYGAKDPDFPVHSTADQLFSGETFDAYQVLGRAVGRSCVAAVTAAAAGAAPSTPPASPTPPAAPTPPTAPVPTPAAATAGPAGGVLPSGVTDVRDVAVRGDDVADAASELDSPADAPRGRRRDVTPRTRGAP